MYVNACDYLTIRITHVLLVYLRPSTCHHGVGVIATVSQCYLPVPPLNGLSPNATGETCQCVRVDAAR